MVACGGPAPDFAALYSGCWKLAYGVAFRVLAVPEDAEEVVMEAFAYVWPWFDGGGAVSPEHARNALLCKVRNLCLDRVRRKNRRPKTESLDAPRAGSATDSGEDDLFGEVPVLPEQLDGVLKAELAAAIDGAIGSLSERRSIAIRMVMNGYSRDEIASALGTTELAVHTLVCRAKDDLKKEFLKRGIWLR